MSTGCDTVQPGVTNNAGTVVARFAASPDKVSEAAKATLEELKFQFIVARSSKLDGYLSAKTAQNDDVEIKVNFAGDNVSEVKIRIGTFGDEGISLRIIDGIRSRI